jgi:hypothetical protein
MLAAELGREGAIMVAEGQSLGARLIPLPKPHLVVRASRGAASKKLDRSDSRRG